MRKDLQAARKLAAEKHDLAYFRKVLEDHRVFREEEAARKEAERAEKAEKKAAASKKEKKPAKTVEAEDDEDVDMPDATGDPESEGDVSGGSTKTKKRKAEDVSAVLTTL